MTQQSGLLKGLGEMMRHLGARQRVIAENIANSETPGYKSRTLDDPDFGSMVGVASGARRIGRPIVAPTERMAALGASERPGRVREDRDILETKPDGNNVSLEEQLLTLGQVQADFATVTNLYRKQMGLLRTAIGKGA